VVSVQKLHFKVVFFKKEKVFTRHFGIKS